MKLILVCAAALIFLPGPAATAAPPKAAPHPKISAGPTAQVDGIASAVVDRLWAQTDRYWHHGDYARIVALDRIITQADPHFVEGYATGGYLLESLGRNQDAEAFYREGIRNNPHSSYAYFSLGFLKYNTLHDYPAAVQAFEMAARQSDSEYPDWAMLAHSYERVHDLDKAIATWRHIKARWPHGRPANPAQGRPADPTDGRVIDKNLQHDLELQKAAQQSSGGKTGRP